MGKNEEKCWVQHIPWSSKILFCFWIEAYVFFSNGHIRNVVSTLPKVVKIDVENGSVVSTLSNVVQFNVEKRSSVSTLFYVVNFIVDIRNVVSTLIWRCATLRRHINLKTALNWRWNVFWVLFLKEDLKVYTYADLKISVWSCSSQYNTLKIWHS